MSTDRAAFLRRTDVSRETLARLDVYAELLRRWTAKINLVSETTLGDLWQRHFRDSARLLDMAPEGRSWLDLGSGGGFPGAVVAILASGGSRPALAVTLIEADQRKAAFLRTVARETGVPFRVLDERIEDAPPQSADILSARALAPLSTLLGHAHRHMARHGTALFPKGEKAAAEVAEALERWRFRCETCHGETDAESVVLRIGDIGHV